ncbi:hypothetical protein S7335_3476 [Synechococcus sp. PCC 7335]|nr:hypothetical protein S7335_3476 [Synechococcus sp. PCC 7335]
MELQAIREKLHSLRAESASDIGMSPWAGSKLDQISTKKSRSQRPLSISQSDEAKTRSSATAIKTLKHRLEHQTYESLHGSFDGSRMCTSSSSSNSRLDSLDSSSRNSSSRNRAYDVIDRELPQLAELISSINERSQQQASELLSLKRSAQQIAFSHRRRGTRVHPQLDIIGQFIEHSSTASIPQLEVDRNGKLHLSYSTVNLNQAETDAIDNAAIARQQLSSTVPFSEPTASNHTLRDCLEPSQSAGSAIHSNRSKRIYANDSSPKCEQKKAPNLALNQTKRTIKPYKRLLVNLGQAIRKQSKKKEASPITKTQPVVERSSADVDLRSSFSWLDATIWSASAAILRVFLNALILNYPSFQVPLLLVIVCTIAYLIYRAVLSQSKTMHATFRAGAVLLGLFLGSVL